MGGVDRGRERAARGEIGQQDRLGGRENRGRFSHEVHATEDDHIGARARRFTREAERIADIIGNILDFGTLVVVGEDHRVALSRERTNLFLQGGIARDERCSHT